jgi:hypothetical protein
LPQNSVGCGHPTNLKLPSNAGSPDNIQLTLCC